MGKNNGNGNTASPFKWTFIRRYLHSLLAKIAAKRLDPAACPEYVTVIPNVSTEVNWRLL